MRCNLKHTTAFDPSLPVKAILYFRMISQPALDFATHKVQINRESPKDLHGYTALKKLVQKFSAVATGTAE